MTIEEEIAQTIEDNVYLSPWDTERDRMVSAIVTALSPLLNRVRAEGAAQALREFADAVRMPATLFYDGDGPITANDLLRQRAATIEQNSEGNET